MREDYALRYLQKIVAWDEQKLAAEVAWLRRISAYKYDSYQDFFAGERFISSLIRWLNQFDSKDRDYAYSLLRDHVIFLSAAEIQHLVRRTVPAHFHPILAARIAKSLDVQPYEIWATKASAEAYKRIIRRSLFIGLSDGARMDVFRRSNIGIISNEQIVVSYELSGQKLESLIATLKKDEKDETAKFEMVFLIDDFLGSGTTLCRTNENSEWKGKVAKFGQAILEKGDSCFTSTFEIVAHHYIATEFGITRAKGNLEEFSKMTLNPFLKGKNYALTYDLILDSSKRFSLGADPRMDAFLKKYYDPQIMTPSLWEGHCDAHNGFADCGLTLVLEHNTPNNSLGILWAESPSPSTENHRMRSLFRRRQRHS